MNGKMRQQTLSNPHLPDSHMGPAIRDRHALPGFAAAAYRSAEIIRQQIYFKKRFLDVARKEGIQNRLANFAILYQKTFLRSEYEIARERLHAAAAHALQVKALGNALK